MEIIVVKVKSHISPPIEGNEEADKCAERGRQASQWFVAEHPKHFNNLNNSYLRHYPGCGETIFLWNHIGIAP